MAELLAEGMGESLDFLACCVGAARRVAHISVLAKKSLPRLNIERVLLRVFDSQAAWQVGGVYRFTEDLFR